MRSAVTGSNVNSTLDVNCSISQHVVQGKRCYFVVVVCYYIFLNVDILLN
jgi:hypothetical protein